MYLSKRHNGSYYLAGVCVVIVTLLLTSTKVSQVTTCLNHNVVRSIAMSAGVELLLDGDLICLNVYKYSSFVALNAKSVGLYPGDSQDDAEGEFFLDDVAVEGPAAQSRFII